MLVVSGLVEVLKTAYPTSHSPAGHFARRWDVLVEPEEIGRIVTTLDSRQTVPGRSRVGRAYARHAFVAEKVDIPARVTSTERRR